MVLGSKGRHTLANGKIMIIGEGYGNFIGRNTQKIQKYPL